MAPSAALGVPPAEPEAAAARRLASVAIIRSAS